jgi:hypothetical protein
MPARHQGRRLSYLPSNAESVDATLLIGISP